MTLTELIKDNFVYFDSYRQGFFYYILHDRSIVMDDPDFSGKKEKEVPEYIADRFLKLTKYQFTIPLDDIGNGSLRSSMKAIECLRWIRKAQESGDLIKLPR